MAAAKTNAWNINLNLNYLIEINFLNIYWNNKKKEKKVDSGDLD